MVYFAFEGSGVDIGLALPINDKQLLQSFLLLFDGLDAHGLATRQISQVVPLQPAAVVHFVRADQLVVIVGRGRLHWRFLGLLVLNLDFGDWVLDLVQAVLRRCHWPPLALVLYLLRLGREVETLYCFQAHSLLLAGLLSYARLGK